jgi:hypothetical protein
MADPDASKGPPAFFVQDAPDGTKAEQLYESIRAFNLKQAPGWTITDRRIYQLDYTHKGRDYRSRVGAQERGIGEPVFAILEATSGVERLYFVCTPNRGVLRGGPILVGGREVRAVTDFAGEART